MGRVGSAYCSCGSDSIQNCNVVFRDSGVGFQKIHDILCNRKNISIFCGSVYWEFSRTVDYWSVSVITILFHNVRDAQGEKTWFLFQDGR